MSHERGMELWRPDWVKLMGEQSEPDDAELVTVTRGSLRLGLSALDTQNNLDAYHNYIAAAEEFRKVLA